MYKMNILLKFIISILTIFIVAITGNRIILWFLLFIVSLYNLHKKEYLLLAFDLVLVLFLGLSKDNELALLLFKLGFIYIFLITIYYTLSKKDLLIIKKNSSKEKYFESNYKRIINNINDKKEKYYGEDVSINDKIEVDLNRQYLQSKIRFNDFYKSKSRINTWNKIDTLILIFCIIVFIIMFILR